MSVNNIQEKQLALVIEGMSDYRHLCKLSSMVPYGPAVVYNGDTYRLEGVSRCGMVLLSRGSETVRVNYRKVELYDIEDKVSRLQTAIAEYMRNTDASVNI